MYKLLPKIQTPSGLIDADSILRVADNAFIPMDEANTDYANFKKEVLDGAELQDADGNVMTQEQANAFIKELP
jgi:hypothetical protein